MTEHKTMNTIIHAAFRRDIARISDALAAFPAGSRQRADQLGAAWGNLAMQLHHHHEDEEAIFWPVLRQGGKNDAVIGELEGEHQAMLAALDTADGAMKNFVADPSSEAQASAQSSVGALRSVLDSHLAHEERDLEPVGAAMVGTKELKTAIAATRKKRSSVAGTFFSWLQDGAGPDEITALRHEVPPPVLFMLTKLKGGDYRKRVAAVWK